MPSSPPPPQGTYAVRNAIFQRVLSFSACFRRSVDSGAGIAARTADDHIPAGGEVVFLAPIHPSDRSRRNALHAAQGTVAYENKTCTMARIALAWGRVE
jgi:hypothetical protein